MPRRSWAIAAGRFTGPTARKAKVRVPALEDYEKAREKGNLLEAAFELR